MSWVSDYLHDIFVAHPESSKDWHDAKAGRIFGIALHIQVLWKASKALELFASCLLYLVGSISSRLACSSHGIRAAIGVYWGTVFCQGVLNRPLDDIARRHNQVVVANSTEFDEPKAESAR